MRAAIVENELVTNVIEVEDLQSFTPPSGTIVEIPEGVSAGPGWSYDGSAFIGPEPTPDPVPDEVTKLQLVRALRAAGQWQPVKHALAQAGEETREDWEISQSILRRDPLSDFIAPLIGGNDALDALFRSAAAL